MYRDASRQFVDPTSGFTIKEFDYSSKARYVQELAVKYDTTLKRQYEVEENTVADFQSFKKYFTKFVGSLPALLSRSGLRILFRVKDREGVKRWLVDCERRQVVENADESTASAIIETPALVLNQCTERNMFSVWTASKRLKIFLAKQ